MLRSLILGTFLIALPASAQADCVARFQGKPGTRSDGIIAGAKVGTPCTVSIYTSGPRVAINSIEIVRPPKRGSLRVEGASLIYTAGSAFNGNDSFFIKFRVEGGDGAPRRPARIRYAVSS